jgi:hypothetical protein
LIGIGHVGSRGVAWTGRLPRGEKAVDFGVGRWDRLLPGEQAPDELSLMVDASLKFAVLAHNSLVEVLIRSTPLALAYAIRVSGQ